MLVLTMGVEDSIFIQHEGEVLEVKLCEVRGGKMKLGFEGNRTFSINRDKLLQRAPTMAPQSAEVASQRRRQKELVVA